MDDIFRMALESARPEIVKDLQPKYIMKDLMDCGLITEKQQSLILSEESEELQADILVNCLICEGRADTYNLFIKTLQIDGKYVWLAESLQSKRKILDEKFSHFQEMVTKGGVPHLPPHVLDRSEHQKVIQEKLQEVFKDSDSGWVAIHGMGGSGKSTLAAACVRNFRLFHDLFPQGLYWLKMGNNINEESLLIKMHMLGEKLDPSLRGKIPLNVEMAADRLRVLLTSEEHRKSLLVLDDVWDDTGNIIKHFNFGGRILLTTRNKSILEVTFQKNVANVEIREGVSLPEWLQFLADSWRRNVEDLPRELIRQIHGRTKGSPIVMAFINTTGRKHPNNIEAALKSYLRKFDDNSFITNKRKTPYDHADIFQALELSVEGLEGELQDLYYDLAIFPNGFDIVGKVLTTLWSKEMFDVVEIMTNFVENSVAVQVSNGHTNSYNIHDLYLYYLNYKLTPESLMNRHKRLITRYLEKYEKYENFPDDGYILQFLGHHLKEAHMFDEFPDAFLNLNVLIPKLRATGPADLYGDFERYADLISPNGKNNRKFQDFREFVRVNAHLLTNARYDVRQIALCLPSSSEVFQQAKRICDEDPHASYYEWCNSDRLQNSCILSTQLQRSKISCAKFSHDGEHIISGGKDMIVKISNSNSGREMLHLKGHKDEITWLANCYDSQAQKEVIVSSSLDGSVIVWLVSLRNLTYNKKVRTITKPFRIFKNHSTKVISCCILKDGVTAASMGQNGEAKVWNVRTGSELASWEAHCESFDFGHCDLMPDGSKLVSTAGTFLRLWDISKKLPEWEQEDRHSQFTSACFTSDGKHVLATVNFKVMIYTVSEGRFLFALIEPNRVPLLHCAVLGHFVAASTNGQSVVVWNMDSREVLDYHHGHKGCVCSVSFSPHRKVNNNNITTGESDAEFQLLSAGIDGTVMVWVTSPQKEELEVILREVFSVQFDSSNEPIIAVVDMNNKIKIYNGQQNLIAAENGSLQPALRIHCCALAHKRDKVLYGCTNGSLKLFDVRSKTTKTLYNSKFESDTCKDSEAICCCISKNDTVMVAGHGDGGIYIYRNDVIRTDGHSAQITCLKFFNNDMNLISCSFDNTLKVWKVANGALMFTCEGHGDSVVNCDITLDNKLIASASTDKTLMVWDACSGRLLAQCIGHQDCVRACAFSPCLSLLASGDDSGIVKLWPIDTANLETAQFENGFSNGDNMTVSRQTIQPLSFPSFGKCNSWIHDLSFSADGSKFVVCADVIQCWSITGVTNRTFSPRLLQTFPIRGSKASRIFCSKQFESFVSIDDTGVIYHLKLITHGNKEDLVNNI